MAVTCISNISIFSVHYEDGILKDIFNSFEERISLYSIFHLLFKGISNKNEMFALIDNWPD